MLGFSNKKKIGMLDEWLAEVEKELSVLNGEKSDIEKERGKQDILFSALNKIVEYRNYDMIDVISVQKSIEDKRKRIVEINESNDILLNLKKQRDKKVEELDGVKKQIITYIKEIASKETKYDSLLNQKKENDEKLSRKTQEDRAIYDFLELDFAKFTKKEFIVYDEKSEKSYLENLNKRKSNLERESGRG